MRLFILAAALTVGVAHADVTETIDLTYASGATFDGTIVSTSDFSAIISLNGTLKGYDGTLGTGFLGAGFSESITALSPVNYNLSPNTFFTQMYDDTAFNLLDFGYSYDSSGITLSPGGAEDPTFGLVGYNNINYGTYGDVLVSGTVTSALEPATLALLALGLVGVFATHRRRTMTIG
jgi:PEP-CTERM motif